MKFLKNNRYLILIIIVMIFIGIHDFSNVYKSEKRNIKMYNDCLKDSTLFYCNSYDESYKEFPGSDTPLIMINTLSNEYTLYLPYLFPILIMVAVILDNYKDFKYKRFKEIFQRENYKKYKFRLFLRSYKYCAIYPLFILFIFILCYKLSGHFYYRGIGDYFTYDISYLKHFGVFLVIMILNGIFHTILWSNFSLISLRKNMNKYISMVYAIFIFSAFEVFNEIILQNIVCNKILKINGGAFNLFDIFLYEHNANMYFVIIVSFIYTLLSLIIVYIIYKNKEKLIIDSEKN